jgi:hypothetical protein
LRSPVPALTQDNIPIKKVSAIIEQEEIRRTIMGGPRVRADEKHEPHAFAAKFLRNPNPRGRRATNDKCTHCIKIGHKKEGYLVLHSELRPPSWVDQSEEGRKGEKNDHWRGNERNERDKEAY